MSFRFHLNDAALSQIVEDVADNRMILVGEVPHGNPSIRAAVATVVTRLASVASPVTLAIESVYGLRPFLERDSLSALPSEFIDPVITRFNAEHSAKERIMVTAIDLEHSIRHSLHQTLKFLTHLAHLSTSEIARADLIPTISGPPTTRGREQMHQWLRTLEEKFKEYAETFSAEAIEEITFSLSLMHVSLDFSSPEGRYSREVLSTGDLEMLDLRANWFRKTIERAWNRAGRRNSRLCCYVGAPHAAKTLTTDDGPIVGTWTEGYYFQELFRETRGQVFSLLVRSFSFQIPQEFVTEIRDPLEVEAERQLEGAHFTYVSLQSKEHLPPAWRTGKYFAAGVPMYDGLLFLK